MPPQARTPPPPASLAESAAAGGGLNLGAHTATGLFHVLAGPGIAGAMKMLQTAPDAARSAGQRFLGMLNDAGSSVGGEAAKAAGLGPGASMMDSNIPGVQSMLKYLLGRDDAASNWIKTQAGARLDALHKEAPEIVRDVAGGSQSAVGAHTDISDLERDTNKTTAPLYAAAANQRVATPQSVKAMMDLPHAGDTQVIQNHLQAHLDREFVCSRSAGLNPNPNDFQLFPREVDAQGNRLFDDQGNNLEAKGLRAQAQGQTVATPQTIKDLAADPANAKVLAQLQTHLDNIRGLKEAAGEQVNPEDYQVFVGGKAAPEGLGALGNAQAVPAQLNSKLPMSALLRLRDSLPEPSSVKYNPLADAKASLTSDLHAASPQLARAEKLEGVPEKRELLQTMPMQSLMDLKNSLKDIQNKATGGAETLGNSSLARLLGSVPQERFPAVEGLRTQLSNELHAASPEYAQADQLTSHLETAKEAYAEGQKFQQTEPPAD